MITGKIRKHQYEQKLASLSETEMIKVVTLDGSPVKDGFAFLFRKVDLYHTFTMYYKKGADYMQTTIFASRGDGHYCLCSGPVDTGFSYHGETVGNYPDTAESFECFVSKLRRRPLTYPGQSDTSRYPADFLLTYPGPLFALEFSEPWNDKRYIIADHFGSDFTTDSLQDLQRELFDTFLLMGLSF